VQVVIKEAQLHRAEIDINTTVTAHDDHMDEVKHVQIAIQPMDVEANLK